MTVFFDVFWEDLKTFLISSFKSAFDNGELSNSQNQAVIRLIEKKIKIKDIFKIFIKCRFENSF